MKIASHLCSSDYIQSRRAGFLKVAHEAFVDLPDEVVLGRLANYPEVILAEDREGVAGYVFLTHHRLGDERLVGMRFMAVSRRWRDRSLGTFLTTQSLSRVYLRYLAARLRPGAPRALSMFARICSAKAYHALARGNRGVSPDLYAAEPSDSVAARRRTYRALAAELDLADLDLSTGLLVEAAADAGIRPTAMRMETEAETAWQRYVPQGSEVLMIMPVDRALFIGNARRLWRVFLPGRRAAKRS